MPTFESTSEFLKLFAYIIGAIAGVLYAFGRFHKLIEDRVSMLLEHPETLRKIASRIRPVVVFDDMERILSDSGGMDHLSSISVSREVIHGNTLPTKITITPKAFLAVPPILSALGSFQFHQTADRGTGFSWVFTLTPLLFFDPSEAKEKIPLCQFRLELLLQ